MDLPLDLRGAVDEGRPIVIDGAAPLNSPLNFGRGPVRISERSYMTDTTATEILNSKFVIGRNNSPESRPVCCVIEVVVRALHGLP